MSTALLTAGQVMDKAAALLNDVSRSIYTYPIQVPYLQVALQELEEYFALHSAAVSESQSIVIPVDAGVTEVDYDGLPSTPLNPHLPSDMIELQRVWESDRGTTTFIPMRRVEYLPHNVEGAATSFLGVYVWQEQKLMFLPSSTPKDLKLDYLKSLFTDIVDETSVINIVNARTFLEFRTAGLLAEFIECNETNQSKLNNYASLAMDRATGITVKGKQTIMTRRRPFRSGYKRIG